MSTMANSEPQPSRSQVRLKTPKGTRDWVGQDILLREKIFSVITSVFQRHGGIPLDTPVFELRPVLAGKYGEDARLIYNLEDQGSELCSLRYDLTVPFARWLAMRNVKHIRRYQIAKVYRRDQPAIKRGRLREFWQCDFDIAGSYDAMIPDVEILRIVMEVFRGLAVDVTIKINHRKILDGVFAVCGVPPDQFRTISSSVDKLDKTPWDEIRREMVAEKGLAEDAADRIGQYVMLRGPVKQMIETIKDDSVLFANEDVKAGLEDMILLRSYLEAMRAADNISFDLSLARGLNYYTGIIYEVLPRDPSLGVGSIAGGGRYDDLVGMYGKEAIPCVGLSFGVDRIFTILDSRRRGEQDVVARKPEAYIIAAGGKDFDGFLPQRMEVASRLWDAGVRVEFSTRVKPKLLPQWKASEGALVGIILGQEEMQAGLVRVKDLRVRNEGAAGSDRGKLVKLEDVVDEVQGLLRDTKM